MKVGSPEWIMSIAKGVHYNLPVNRDLRAQMEVLRGVSGKEDEIGALQTQLNTSMAKLTPELAYQYATNATPQAKQAVDYVAKLGRSPAQEADPNFDRSKTQFRTYDLNSTSSAYEYNTAREILSGLPGRGDGNVSNGTTTPEFQAVVNGTGTSGPIESDSKLGEVIGLDNSPIIPPKDLPGPLRNIGVQASREHELQKPVLEEQARRTRVAMDATIQNNAEFQSALDTIKGEMAVSQASAQGAFDSVISKAEEYASDAATRTSEGLKMIDEWGQKVYDTMSAGKVHDMQVAVQSTIDSASAGLRNVEQQFGAGSPEAAQYRMGLSRSLQIAQSTIQAQYQKNLMQIGTDILGTKSTFLDKSNMYTSFQQQQDVQISFDVSKAAIAMDMDYARQDLAVEQFSLAGNQEVVIEYKTAPVVYADSMELVSFLAQLTLGQLERDSATYAAKKASDAQESAGKYSMWGAIAGGLLGGPMGAGIGSAVGNQF